jgi:predicted dehydrogenase
MTLRLALLGYGFIGKLHHEAADACQLDVTHICRRDDDWLSAVRAPDVDAVVIGTPNAFHYPQTMAALEAGKHVLVEKPMAFTTTEAIAMRDAAAASGRTLLVGHMWRYRDEVIATRDRIADGAVGRPVRTRGYGIHAGWGPSGWFTDRALAGGGALIDMGIHAIDTARFLLAPRWSASR